MSKKLLMLVSIFFIGWLLKHFTVLPIIDFEEHEITGIEFKIRF